MASTMDYEANLLLDTSEESKLQAYRANLNSYLEYFFQFMETFNQALTKFIDTGVLQKDFMKLKFRIKDPSSIQNSTTESWLKIKDSQYKEKAIDDVFGVEIQTATEEQKELISIFMKTLLELGSKENYHDKANGYKAYHTLGYCQLDVTLEKNIEYFLTNFPEYCDKMIGAVDFSQIPNEETDYLNLQHEIQSLITQLIQTKQKSSEHTGFEKDNEQKQITSDIVQKIKELLNKLREESKKTENTQTQMYIFNAVDKISYISKYFWELSFVNNLRFCPNVVGKMITDSDLDRDAKSELKDCVSKMVQLQANLKETQEQMQKMKNMPEHFEIKGMIEELEIRKTSIIQEMSELQTSFTNLILNNGYIDHLHLDNNIVTAFKSARSVLKSADIDSQTLPAIEFQIKTQEVAQEAIYGKAAHSGAKGYKSVNETNILKALRTQTLLPGLTAPLKFFRNSSGQLELQDFYETIVENYSFAKDFLLIYRNASAMELDETEENPIDRAKKKEADQYFENYDKRIFMMLHEIGVVFPAFRPYIDSGFNFKGSKFSKFSPDAVWKHLSTIFLRKDTLTELTSSERSQVFTVLGHIEDRYDDVRKIKGV